MAAAQIIHFQVPGNGDIWDAWGNLGQCPIFWLCHSGDYRLQSFPMKLQHNFIYSSFRTSRPSEGMNMCAVPLSARQTPQMSRHMQMSSLNNKRHNIIISIKDKRQITTNITGFFSLFKNYKRHNVTMFGVVKS